MTYSIVVRDERTGHMGVACQSQAFAVGSSVPWAASGIGIVATQSMGEPMYGSLGLDALQAGLSAAEAMRALRSVDPFPERRQVAMVDSYGGFDVYTGEACVAAAGHRVGRGCAALANMVVSADVWIAMVHAWETTDGPVAQRLMAALQAAEDEGGDFRGRRSAAIIVVQSERTGRPWRDQLVDLRVDDGPDPVGELGRLVARSERYHRTVEAFDLAIGGDTDDALRILGEGLDPDPAGEPDVALWTAIVLALSGRDADAAALFRRIGRRRPEFVEAARRFDDVGLLPEPGRLRDLLPDA